MLTRIHDVESFRTFRGPWSPSAFDGTPLFLGKRTVIYGKNGAGKSTLAALVNQLVSGSSEVNMRVTWKGAPHRARVGVLASIVGLYIFDQNYVQKNLRAFLSGEGGCDALVRLGQPQIEDADRQTAIEHALSDNDAETKRASTLKAQASAKIGQLENDTKLAIIDALEHYDARRYGTATFRIPAVRALLSTTLTSLGETRGATLAETRQTELPELSIPVPPTYKAMLDLRHEVSTAVQRPIDSVSLASLDDDRRLSEWIRQALAIHEGEDNCKFCTGDVPPDLRLTYQRHFDRSREDLQTLLETLHSRIAALVAQWETWFTSLPRNDAFFYELQTLATVERERATTHFTESMNFLHLLDTAVTSRLEDLSTPATDIAVKTPLPPDIAEYERLRVMHEDRRANLAASRRVAAEKIEYDIAHRAQSAYKNAQIELAAADAEISRLAAERDPLQFELSTLRAARHDTATIASDMSAAMKSYFGHAHLSIQVSGDGDSYSVRRGTKPAHHLSEGEANGIAFLYFLHSLRADGVDAQCSTVVIDDPVSSLDADAIFATHNFIATQLEDFAQVVVLTHNFDLFRLLWRRWVSNWRLSIKLRKSGDATEIASPSVQFLEMRAIQSLVGTDQVRHSELREMPRTLMTHANEYHYLFHKVYRSANDQDDPEAPLMANAARRLVEGFLAFKVPGSPNITKAYEDLEANYPVAQAICDRVQNFTNTLSHRQDPNPQSSINFTGVQEELKYVLKLIEEADKHHYDGLVKATKVDQAV